MEYFKKSKFIYVLTTLILILLSVWLLKNVSFILTPFMMLFNIVILPVGVAGYLYYIFAPLLNFLKRKLKHEGLSILIVFIVLGIVFGAMVVFLASLLGQIQLFITRMPSHITSISASVRYVLTYLKIEEVYIVESLEWLNLSVFKVISIVGNSVLELVVIATRSVFSIIMALFTIPIVLLFMFKDGAKIPKVVTKISPEKYKRQIRIILTDIHLKLSSFIGGQVLVCLYVGVSAYALFKFLGIPYAIFFAALAGVMDIVPYVGPWLGVFPAFVLAWIISPQTAIILVIVIVIIQTLESYVVYPAIMGKSLNMHPLTIIFLLMFAGSVGGIVGMIVAMPLYSVLKSIVLNVLRFKDMEDSELDKLESSLTN